MFSRVGRGPGLIRSEGPQHDVGPSPAGSPSGGESAPLPAVSLPLGGGSNATSLREGTQPEEVSATIRCRYKDMRNRAVKESKKQIPKQIAKKLLQSLACWFCRGTSQDVDAGGKPAQDVIEFNDGNVNAHCSRSEREDIGNLSITSSNGENHNVPEQHDYGGPPAEPAELDGFPATIEFTPLDSGEISYKTNDEDIGRLNTTSNNGENGTGQDIDNLIIKSNNGENGTGQDDKAMMKRMLELMNAKPQDLVPDTDAGDGDDKTKDLDPNADVGDGDHNGAHAAFRFTKEDLYYYNKFKAELKSSDRSEARSYNCHAVSGQAINLHLSNEEEESSNCEGVSSEGTSLKEDSGEGSRTSSSVHTKKP